MLRIALLCLLGLSLPAAVWAGAWPRGAGNVFLSAAREWTTTEDHIAFAAGARAYENGRLTGITEFESFGYGSLYGEIGITDRITLGFDAGAEDAADTFQWIAFGAIAVTPPEWRFQATVEMGLGRREFPEDPPERAPIGELRPGGTEAVFRPGLLLGYGFTTPWGGGWTTLELRQERRQERDETVDKVDVTLGLAPGARSLVYVQAQYTDYPLADPNLRLVPTYVRRFGDHLSLETALLADVWGSGDRVGIRAGLWVEF